MSAILPGPDVKRRPPDDKCLQEYTRKYTDKDLCFTRVYYAAMKAAYESALDGVEQEDSDREYSFLEGWSATAVVHGDWMEWQIAELELQIPNGQPASQA